MNLFALKYLQDISDAISDLENCLIDVKSFEDFSADFALKRVTERQFEIIGEALRKYNAIENIQQIDNTKKIIGLRNIIAHAYDSVDYALLWSIIKIDPNTAGLLNEALAKVKDYKDNIITGKKDIPPTIQNGRNEYLTKGNLMVVATGNVALNTIDPDYEANFKQDLSLLDRFIGILS